MHGFGVFTWPDGRKYEGWWKDGVQQGDGLEFSSEGKVVCQWADGKRLN